MAIGHIWRDWRNVKVELLTRFGSRREILPFDLAAKSRSGGRYPFMSLVLDRSGIKFHPRIRVSSINYTRQNSWSWRTVLHAGLELIYFHNYLGEGNKA